MTSVFVRQSMWGFHRSQEPQIHLLSTQLESASNEMDGDHQRLWSVYQLNSRQSYCHDRCLSRQSFCNNLMIQEIQPALSEEFRKLNLELVSQVFLAIWWSRRLLKIRLSRTITRWLNQNIKEKLQKPKYKSFSLDNPFFSIRPGSTKRYLDMKFYHWWMKWYRSIFLQVHASSFSCPDRQSEFWKWIARFSYSCAE